MAQVELDRATATTGNLLERAEELAALADRLGGALSSGRGHVVLIRGEAGSARQRSSGSSATDAGAR